MREAMQTCAVQVLPCAYYARDSPDLRQRYRGKHQRLGCPPQSGLVFASPAQDQLVI
jgi:hypothetical protein